MSSTKKLQKNAKEQRHAEVARPSKKQQKNAAADKSKKLLEPPKKQPQSDGEAAKSIGPPSKKLGLDPEQKQKSQKIHEPTKAETQGEDAAAAADAPVSDLPICGPASKKKLIPQQKSIATEILVKPRKKEKPKHSSESYTVELFGRTQDLSKFNESTALYSMCRAWMSNQPRTIALSTCSTDGGNVTVKREDNAEEVLAQLKSGSLNTLSQIPKARSTKLTVVPPRMVYTDQERMNEMELQGAKGEVLLALNVARWKRIRQHWQEHTRNYNHERYELIDQIVNVAMKGMKNN